MRGKRRSSWLLEAALIIFFACFVVLPLVRMLLFVGSTDVGKILTSSGFRKAAGNSVLAGLLTTLISIPLAYAMACCTIRAHLPLRGLWTVLFSLPMLIPSISQGSGLILLFGANGVITRALHLEGNIYGLHGIIIGEAMYVTPVVFLMFANVLRYEDYTPYEAAQALGIPRHRQFTAITLPFLRRPLLSAVFTAFSLTVTDYGVPLTVGGKFKTLPVLMYEDVIGLLDFGKGSVIGAVLLIPAVLAFAADLAGRQEGPSAFLAQSFRIRPSRLRDGAALILCAAVGGFMLLPAAAFAALTFLTNYPVDMTFTLANIQKTLTMNGAAYLRNSVLISLGAGLLGTALGAASAYCAVRLRTPCSRLLHLFSITSMAVPGLVLGLSYVLFFRASLLYGTLALLILVNLIHFFASPYLMFHNTYEKINEHLEAVGLTLGISRLRIVRDVILPQCRGTLLEAFAYFFVNSMITISAVSFLANSANKPLALLIPQYEAQSFLECSAFVSLLILLCNLAVKALVYLLRRAGERDG